MYRYPVRPDTKWKKQNANFNCAEIGQSPQDEIDRRRSVQTQICPQRKKNDRPMRENGTIRMGHLQEIRITRSQLPTILLHQ